VEGVVEVAVELEGSVLGPLRRSGMALEDSVPSTDFRYLSRVPDDSEGVSREKVKLCIGVFELIDPLEEVLKIKINSIVKEHFCENVIKTYRIC